MEKKALKELIPEEFAVNHRIDSSYIMDRYHFHNVFEIYFANVGGVKYFVEDKVFPVEKNDIFVFNNTDLHRIVVPEGVLYDRYIITFSPEYICNMSTFNTNLLECFTDRKYNFSHRICLTQQQAGRFLSLLKKAENFNPELYGADVLKKMVLCEMLIFINQLYHNAAPTQNSHYNSEYIRIKPVLDDINSNLNDNLTLDALAERFFISKFHLCKLFKAATGFTVNEYIISRRILKACDLLRRNHTVASVCELTGFHNDCYFITTFKRLVGITPKQYAKKENR